MRLGKQCALELHTATTGGMASHIQPDLRLLTERAIAPVSTRRGLLEGVKKNAYRFWAILSFQPELTTAVRFDLDRGPTLYANADRRRMLEHDRSCPPKYCHRYSARNEVKQQPAMERLVLCTCRYRPSQGPMVQIALESLQPPDLS